MKRAILLTAALLAGAVIGCTPAQPPAVVAPVRQREAKYVVCLVIDDSGSFHHQLENRGWPFVEKILKGFYRDRAGEDDLLVIGQISATTVAPIYEGSPVKFLREHGNGRAFRDLVRSKSNPNGSRVHDSVADTARYALRFATDDNQVFLAVLSDFIENFPEPEKSEERMVQALSGFKGPRRACGFYWVDVSLVERCERNLRRAGVTNFVVGSSIQADPQLPMFAE